MRKSFAARVNQNNAIKNSDDSNNGVAMIVGRKIGGTPYVWIGERFTTYRAIISARSMDAVCRAWIALRKLRGEWKS